MSKQAKNDAKVEKPSAHFDEPHEVVADPSLSNVQKNTVLDTLEQDARQLAEASSEGMAGGELNKPHDVLNAKDMLALPPVAGAYQTVRLDLRSRVNGDQAIYTRIKLRQAIAALEAVSATLERPSASATEGLAKAPGGAEGLGT